MSRSKTSAGLLVFRKSPEGIEVLLVHPGGPFFRRKDAGAWTIPKGEVAEGEDVLTRARIEFQEELGFAPPDRMAIALGSVRQKGGKTVQAWAVKGDFPAGFLLRSNSFEIEWPPRSGKMESFPEVDQAEFFSLPEARLRINPAQAELLDRLVEHLNSLG